MTGTILDAYERQMAKPWYHPANWRRKPPTALQLAVADLEECRKDRLDHMRNAEYHSAMANMLELRDVRLQADIKMLSTKD